MTRKLASDDIRFLRLIQQAIFTNPFSPEWVRASTAISGLSADSTTRKRRQAMEKAAAKRLEKLARQGITSISTIKDNKQRDLLRYAFLFATFHDFAPHIDSHINEQVSAGPEPIVFSHGPQIMAHLQRCGLLRQEASHAIALFFQMRRAFFFIDEIKGKTAAMTDLRRNLWRNIFTDDISLYERLLWNRMEDFSTLILGPTGSGKGMVAAAIGRSGFIPYQPGKQKFSESFTAAFVSLNLSQIAEGLLESELFGHQKGAFTGATHDHNGVFARCSPHGAIFLDEIGEISPQIQVKLLHTLQERHFTPLGSTASKRFSGRVIAATNQNLDELRQKGTFRHDFYYRLCSDSIIVPDLRHRIEQDKCELELLVQVVLTKITGREEKDLAMAITRRIRELAPADYHWPGNVRELEQCVRRMLIKNSYEFQQPPAPANGWYWLSTQRVPAQEIISRYCQMLYELHGTYEAVARISQLDRRTVKKYIEAPG